MSASPLALLREWPSRTNGSALHEFLLVGSHIDLPSLERDVIPTARESGAAVTVLGAADPGAEPAALSRPERTLALIEHTTYEPLPELVLLLGDGHVTVGFGGGAPSAGQRPWSLLRGTPDGVPWALAEVGAWLRGRAATPPVPATMAARLVDIADRLEEVLLAAPVDGDAQVVHNLDRPLLNLLPRGPVDELWLYAPPRGAEPECLRALTDHLSPTSVVLAVPGDWPPEDTEATLKNLAEAGVQAGARLIAEGHPRHGGLLEWVVDQERHALTLGSHLPALTRPANEALTLAAIVPATAPPPPVPPDQDQGHLSHLAEELGNSGWELEFDSGIHRVYGTFTNPVPVAARVVELLDTASPDQGTAPILVHAQGPKAWALLVWSRPMMLLASAPRGSAWRLYRVDPPATPSSRLGGGALSQVGLVRTSAPLHRAPHRDVSAFLHTLDTDHITLLEKVGFLNKPL